MQEHPFELDGFQKTAIECIHNNVSVLVSAPTGAGKTLIAEYAVDDCMKSGKRVIYTAPIKALSNQKYRDFSRKYGPDAVGILTGDVTINREARILLMTTEILRNTIFESPASLHDVGWVIFDEIHYIDDYERGTVWEEALLFCPSHVRVVGLSATVPNVDELGKWMEDVLGMPVEVIVEPKRPVPLRHSFQCRNTFYERFKDLRQYAYPKGYKRAMRADPDSVVQNRIDGLIHELKKKDNFPCIYFVFSRKRSETIAIEMSKFKLLSGEESVRALALFDELCDKIGISGEDSVIGMRRLVASGVGFHHAGMLPSLKEVVERIFTHKLLRIICTTETFALGINMPVRSVVFDELRKYHGTHFGNLRTRDYFQMAGRAGRRGMDEFGTVYSRVNPRWIDAHSIERIVFGKAEPVMSRFSSSYAVVINLYGKYGDALVDVYPRTFHHYQAGTSGKKEAVAMLERKIELLKTLEYISERGGIDRKGVAASRIYGYELLITELYAAGMFSTLSPTEIAIVIAAVIYEPRRGDKPPELDGRVHDIKRQVRKVSRQINRMEKRFGVPLSPRANFHLTPCLEDWTKGMSFSDMARNSTIDEGTMIRYFRMVIQVCRQILSIPEIPYETARRVGDCMRAVNRDEVDAERELRSGLSAPKNARAENDGDEEEKS